MEHQESNVSSLYGCRHLQPEEAWNDQLAPAVFCGHPVRSNSHSERTTAWALQVLIRRGELVAGTLCKKTLGAAGGGLVHITWMEHGPDATRRLINNTQVCHGKNRKKMKG